MDFLYNNYASFLKEKFGGRVQKISLNTGFTCPNRDGSKGQGGCTYCNNQTFSPAYTSKRKDIAKQLEDGIFFFSKKYKTQEYLAYFQSYTNTYADIQLVKELYLEALSHPKVVGLVIGTRPDCINEELIDFLSDLAKNNYVSLEFGVESTLNKTLERINRCHTYEETIAAYELAKDKGIHLGAHIILGLPGETRAEMMQHAIEISKLPIETLKIHQLQIVKHTMMEKEFAKYPEKYDLFELDEYVRFISEFITLLRPSIFIERFTSESPKHLLVAPNWGGFKNFEVVEKIRKELVESKKWQGKNY
ncbi:MAG: TIGR01212 family radical SAM protein [Flavobacteriia bacterium]|nr:TIGR01212 family radical SAM protein [Flavobacteriia bacterium]